MHPGVHAAKWPDKPAYIMANSGETVTYRQLEERSRQGAQLFRKLGLGPGGSIAILMENNARFLEICWAAQRAGLYYTCISSHLSPGEIDYIVDDCDATLFLTSAAKQAVAEDLRERMPRVRNRLMVNGSIAGYEPFEAARAAMPAEPPADECEGSDMLYSSGTTGRPKGIRNEITGEPFGTPPPTLAVAARYYRLDENGVYLSPAPLYHAAPLRFNLTVHRLGATSIVMEHFEAERALQLIEQYRPSHSQWVPTMFVRMLKLPEAVRRRYDVSSMRVAIHAAAPCPVPVKEQMIAWWGPVLYEYYAGTEGNGMTVIDSREWLSHKGSVGRALVGVVHILDEAGEEQPPGEPGLIYFAEGKPFAYHKDPQKTAESRNGKGWSTLGDVGYLDEEGYLYLTDRKAHMIISGGVNIYPQEVENLLVTHPRVLDAAVIGVPNEEFGEEVRAVVQPLDMAEAGPALAQELIGFCRQQLSHVKCPRAVDFEAELPRHPNGKLYKRLLKDRYWSNRESRIV